MLFKVVWEDWVYLFLTPWAEFAELSSRLAFSYLDKMHVILVLVIKPVFNCLEGESRALGLYSVELWAIPSNLWRVHGLLLFESDFPISGCSPERW